MPYSPEDIDPQVIIALTKTSSAFTKKEIKENRNELQPGEYRVDFLAHVHGIISVHKDHEKRTTSKLPITKVLALFMKYSGVTREAALSAMEQALNHALQHETTVTDAMEELALIDPIYTERVQKFLETLPKEPCKGKVTSKITLNVIAEGDSECARNAIYPEQTEDDSDEEEE